MLELYNFHGCQWHGRVFQRRGLHPSDSWAGSETVLKSGRYITFWTVSLHWDSTFSRNVWTGKTQWGLRNGRVFQRSSQYGTLLLTQNINKAWTFTITISGRLAPDRFALWLDRFVLLAFYGHWADASRGQFHRPSGSFCPLQEVSKKGGFKSIRSGLTEFGKGWVQVGLNIWYLMVHFTENGSYNKNSENMKTRISDTFVKSELQCITN